MTFAEFLSDCLGAFLFQLVLFVISGVFLLLTGTQSGVILLLLTVWLLALSCRQGVIFFKKRAHFIELEAIMDGLDKKYLFFECAPKEKSFYERKLFDLSRQAGRAMIGAVSDAQAVQREYREYVERWVHEIKTPITAASLLCRNIEPKFRRGLSRELSQIEAHVERVLFYARAENPEKDFIIRQTRLNEIVSQSIEQYRTLFIQSNIRIETKNLDQLIFTDKKWAVFILGQLLQNAARYCGETPVITLSAKPLGKQIQLTVRDNGVGIPKHELPRVFDRGFTGSNGRLRGGSTGMGLYLCKKLADCLEIGLQVTSKEGRETAVMLTFPAKENLTKL